MDNVTQRQNNFSVGEHRLKYQGNNTATSARLELASVWPNVCLVADIFFHYCYFLVDSHILSSFLALKFDILPLFLKFIFGVGLDHRPAIMV